MLLVIDNYDSFTWNLVHLIGAERNVVVKRNDALSAGEAIAMAPEAIVLSPGPGLPADAGICVDVVRAAAAAGTPLFGVCLGLQAIAAAMGGGITRAQKLMHGKTSRIRHQGDGLFAGVPDRFTATRYHSLIADPDTLSGDLNIVATSDDDGEIMAIMHKSAPIAGVQFHPESIATEFGGAIFENFLQWAKG
ncbi:MAG TPA: aminodeoxychorismate/anthranilate synthase component II [Parvularculaceae bacterium]|nr:aminodeoxychorismate/anthranilate synthase component II [Parvularculaceae bacterium]